MEEFSNLVDPINPGFEERGVSEEFLHHLVGCTAVKLDVGLVIAPLEPDFLVSDMKLCYLEKKTVLKFIYFGNKPVIHNLIQSQ
jgi:hypothetical protein